MNDEQDEHRSIGSEFKIVGAEYEKYRRPIGERMSGTVNKREPVSVV